MKNIEKEGKEFIMSMYVNAVRTPQVTAPKTTMKQSVAKGALGGGIAGAVGSITAGLALTPKVMSHDAFIKDAIKGVERFANEAPKEQYEQAIKELTEQAEGIYGAYREVAQRAANEFKHKIPKAALIGTAVACAVGAGIAALIHHNKNKEVPKTK